MKIKPTNHVDLSTSFGPMRTHLFRPAEERKFPGIILYSEIYQMTGPIARTAAIIAGQGFIVAVPEVYHEFAEPGEAFAYDKHGTDRGNELKTTKELRSFDEDARAVIDFFRHDGGCTGGIGTIGICLGGHLAFRTAMNPEIEAGVCFYATDIHKRSLGKGMCDDSIDRMKEIRGEMMLIWGRQDPHIPAEGRRVIYDSMTQAKVNFTWHEFNGEHAFMRDEGPRYDPAIAHSLLGMVFDLFARRLKS